MNAPRARQRNQQPAVRIGKVQRRHRALRRALPQHRNDVLAMRTQAAGETARFPESPFPKRSAYMYYAGRVPPIPRLGICPPLPRFRQSCRGRHRRSDCPTSERHPFRAAFLARSPSLYRRRCALFARRPACSAKRLAQRRLESQTPPPQRAITMRLVREDRKNSTTSTAPIATTLARDPVRISMTSGRATSKPSNRTRAACAPPPSR